MKERDHCMPGVCSGASANSEIVHIPSHLVVKPRRFRDPLKDTARAFAIERAAVAALLGINRMIHGGAYAHRRELKCLND